MKVTHRLAALQTTSPAAGVIVFDFGQNVAGWTRLSITGQRGARVQLRHAEILTHQPVRHIVSPTMFQRTITLAFLCCSTELRTAALTRTV